MPLPFPSMHARQEDLKLMISLFRPSYYLPIKGDFSLLMANAKLATELGIGLNHYNTFVYDNGMALIFDSFGKQVHKNILIKNGDVMVDGNSVGDVKETAIEERTKMADGGVVVIGLAYSSKAKKILSNPDIQMRGFLYLKDSEPLLAAISSLFLTTVNTLLTDEKKHASIEIEKKAADKISRYIIKNTNKEPMVFCKLVDIDDMELIDPR